MTQQYNQQNVADSSQCYGCAPENSNHHKFRSNGEAEDPVTSSTFGEKLAGQSSPDSRPIQGGTVSTSVDGSQSDPPTPNSHTSTPPIQQQQHPIPQAFMYSQNIQREECVSRGQGSAVYLSNGKEMICRPPGLVTTMASGRTFGSNTITSVLAGRASTATVSINTPPGSSGASTPSSMPQTVTVNVTKSPLEMVQSVVSSIQVPNVMSSTAPTNNNHQQMSPQIIKHSPTGLPQQGHILVSSGGQLIMASAGNGVMAPPPPKMQMPPMSVSSMMTNVTGSVTQVIPAVAQQVLGQQTVLVNALQTPSFVLQPGVTMTMDGMTVHGQNVQIPQLLAGNVIQQQIQIDNQDRRGQQMASPETKKKGKKRKTSSQTVAGMLHIAAQQNSGVVSFPQQIQMAHSPQGITAGPMMQALTIVPSKTQLITNPQPGQQINLLQPVNLINGVQNFPIQQFIVPNLGGSSVVMNADGTATIVQDAGVQLQLQNVLTPVQSQGIFGGAQGILAAGPAGMVIRAPQQQAAQHQGKLVQQQQQQHSPGAQFLAPNGGQFVVNGAQFGGQLSPLVASDLGLGRAFSSSPQTIRANNAIQPQQQQEYIQCNQMGQTLMVPANIAVSSSNQQQNTTYVQQNTTIVQQQTTMVSNGGHNSNQNFVVSDNSKNQQLQQLQPQLQAVVLQPHCRQSVSTQTAGSRAQSVFTSAGSPPDTTTMSPMASSGGQSPPTADTTTHSGSTDDGLSPAPSSCSDLNLPGRHQSCSMAMVHCISSSEPDSADLNNQNINFAKKSYAESSTFAAAGTHAEKNFCNEHVAFQGNWNLNYDNPNLLGFMLQMSRKLPVTNCNIDEYFNKTTNFFAHEHLKQQQEAVVSSRDYDKQMKRKNSDAMVVMETMHTSMFEDDEGTDDSDDEYYDYV
ncbi:unnamed protein product [Brassicogethes aeneus]|uniref:Uncharacterized protein n=1 Tax=Brassicogethes aeneus TaxID=1431903 RepID=A0A9P0B3C9_BRAAE|nr:unnamed protein product [Brassicogethes aeneus]